MAKRFTSTDIWGEDWYLDMPNEYKLFWFYMLSACDHSGIFKVNTRSFGVVSGSIVCAKTALAYFNKEKQRIREINQSVWYIEEFFVYQYGATFNLNNSVHDSIEKIYNKYGIEMSSIRGLREVKERTKRGQGEVSETTKDKDKDISSLKEVKPIKKTENTEEEINFQNEKIFSMLIPEMMEIWKKHKPNYPIDKEKDFHSLLQMAYRIAEQNGWKRSEVVDLKKVQVIEFWEKMAIVAAADAWYSSKPLSVIISQWQGVFQKVNEIKKDSPKKMVF